jgi:hypothetical protein
MRNGALATAGFAAAIIILLSQVKGTPSYSAVSLWAALVSMVVWLFGFLYVSAYLLHGERVYQHINIFTIAAIAVSGYAALFVAIVATVWQLSACAGVALIVLGILLAVASFIHFKSVERSCNASDA